MPVAKAPHVPPTPCTPTTSSASSTPKRSLTNCTPKKQIEPAPRPMMIEAGTVTKPAAGVIATSPATAPAAAPSTLGRRCTAQLTVIQVSAAIAVAVLVLTNACAARPPDVSADPALNPNQPNQSSAAPSTTIGRSCGSMASLPR